MPTLFLLLLSCAKTPAPTAPEAPVVLEIAAINDFHGALYEQPKRKQPERAYGGLPWLVSAVDYLRQENPKLVLLDGGDLFQGSWAVNQSHGMGSVEAFRLLKVDAAAVGNHEFDYGGLEGAHPTRGYLEAAAKEAPFEWLSANIALEDGTPWSPEGIAPWTMIERSGVKLGVIGLTTMDTPQTTRSINVEDLRFTDPVEAVRKTLPELEAAGADVIAVVGHLTGSCEPTSFDDAGAPCTPDGEIGRLLTELPPGTIDLMVLGHAHTLLAHRDGQTILLEQRAKGAAIGRARVVVNAGEIDLDASEVLPPWFLEHDAADPGCTGEAYPTDPRDVGGVMLAPSQPAIDLIAKLESEAGSLCEEVGCTTARFGRSRQAQSAVGDLVSDAMLGAFEGADLALQNSGGLRADLPEGPIRREHLQGVMPFDNRLLLVEVSGEKLTQILQIGSSGAHGILQIAGARYHFDPDVTEGIDVDGDGEVGTWERNRLCSASVQGAPIDPARNYRVVTTDFLFEGGDHLAPAFVGATVIDEGPLLRDVLMAYVSGQSECLQPTDSASTDTPARITVGACSP